MSHVMFIFFRSIGYGYFGNKAGNDGYITVDGQILAMMVVCSTFKWQIFHAYSGLRLVQ